MPNENVKINENEIEWIISKFIEWTNYLPDEETVRWSNVGADIHHSSLLRRLLKGEKIYDYPPPRSFSYPNYQLLDQGTYLPLEVWKVPESTYFGKKNKIAIDQNPEWDILEEKDGSYVVSYGFCPDRFDLRKVGDRWIMSKIKIQNQEEKALP